jgi:hypothetical protein
MSGLKIGGVLLAKLKVAELKAELEARELSKTGKKDELVARLTSYMEVSSVLRPTAVLSSELVWSTELAADCEASVLTCQTACASVTADAGEAGKRF